MSIATVAPQSDWTAHQWITSTHQRAAAGRDFSGRQAVGEIRRSIKLGPLKSAILTEPPDDRFALRARSCVSSTQPGHLFAGRRNEYQPNGGSTLQLGSKCRYGSCVGGI